MFFRFHIKQKGFMAYKTIRIDQKLIIFFYQPITPQKYHEVLKPALYLNFKLLSRALTTVLMDNVPREVLSTNTPEILFDLYDSQNKFIEYVSIF